MVSTRQHRSKSSKAKSLEVAESSDSDFIPTSPSRTAKMAQRSPFGAAPVAPFIIKTYEMVNDPATDHIISWTPDGASFTVTSTETFSKELLPRHFKHNNFSSFVRQLNTYRFRKIDPESWTFKNEYFVRGQPDQLGLIVRKTTDGPKAKGGGKSPASSIQPALEVGAYGGYGTSSVDAVRRDNALLRQEVIRLRHEMEMARAESDSRLHAMETRIDRSDRERRSLIAGIAQALHHPGLMQHLVSSSPNVMRIEDGRGGRRRKVAKKRTGMTTGDDHSSGEDVDNIDSVNNEDGQQLVVHQPPFADLAKQFMQMLTTTGRDEAEEYDRPGKHGYKDTGAFHRGPLVEEAESSQAEIAAHDDTGAAPMNYHENPIVTVNQPVEGFPANRANEVNAINNINDISDISDLHLSPNLSNINLDDYDLGSIGEFDGALSLTESDIERIANT